VLQTYEKEVYKTRLAIIGGGPIGLAVGLAAQKAGIDYLIIEKGCLVNSLYNYPVNMTFFSSSERLEIGDVPFVTDKVRPVRMEALEYYRRIAVSKNLNINLFEQVTSIKPLEKGGFRIHTNKKVIECAYIAICTGFYDIPNKLDIPGEALSKVTHYYKEPHYYAGMKVAVIGANNSAVDAALETWRKGARVTLIHRGDALGESIKYWVKPDIENRIKEGAIEVLYNARVSEIRLSEIDVESGDGTKTIENDFVIAMTGYKPNLEFLSDIGITLAKDHTLQPYYNPETQETNVPGIYLGGVICGGMNTRSWFIENSRVHADLILDDIIRKESNR